MNKLFVLLPVIIFFASATMTLYQVDKIKSQVKATRKVVSKSEDFKGEIAVKKAEIKEIKREKKELVRKLKNIRSNFLMITSNYTQNRFRNEIDSRGQRFGMVIQEFNFGHSSGFSEQKGLGTDQFKLQLTGYYQDFMRFIYRLAEKFSNLDIQRISISRQNVYQEKVKVILKGHLYKYVK